MSKKKPRKGTTKKRHKPAAQRKADELLRWMHDPDTPLRQLVRGAWQDMRLIGDRRGHGIDIGPEGREILAAKAKEAIAAANPKKDPEGFRKLVRTINTLERHRLQALRVETEYMATVCQTYLAETATRVQAALDDAQGDDDDSVEGVTRKLVEDPPVD